MVIVISKAHLVATHTTTRTHTRRRTRRSLLRAGLAALLCNAEEGRAKRAAADAHLAIRGRERVQEAWGRWRGWAREEGALTR